MTARVPALLAVLLAVLALAACGSEDPEAEGEITGDAVAVYSSAPLTGPLAAVAGDLVRAEKLALRDAGGRAGKFDIGYVSLESAERGRGPAAGRWSAEQVAANAREAIEDRQAIAYLGEAEWGASTVSAPILNSAGILQISPLDTYAGLTDDGGRTGEPEKYYPAGLRTFARLVPGDDEQARELAGFARAREVREIVVVDDRSVAGGALAQRVARELEQRGVEVAERLSVAPAGAVGDDVVEKARRTGALLYAGVDTPFARRLLRAVRDAAPDADLFAPADLAGARVERLLMTRIVVPRDERARAFARRFAAHYGHEPAPEAILGYDAMRIVLGAIARAGELGGRRPVVVREAMTRLGPPRARFVRTQVLRGRLRTSD